MYDFTQRKFLSLTKERQHKKCAELLRLIYMNTLKGIEISQEWTIYRQLVDWMNQEPIGNITIKGLADRYHWHLQLAHVKKREHSLLPSIKTGDRSISEEAWNIDIYLDHIRSAHNVGSIIRTTEALRLGTLYFSPDTPFITQKQVRDTSMGAYEWVNCQQEKALSSLKKPIIVLETSEDALSLYEFIFPESFTLVLGNEEYGCSHETLALANYLVEIPLRGKKNSLNVANAFALVGGEIQRQRLLPNKDKL